MEKISSVRKGKYFKIRWRKNNLEENRIYIIIPTKRIKKAVRRNRIRRMIKPLFSNFLEKGYDIHCLYLGDENYQEEEIREEVKKLIRYD